MKIGMGFDIHRFTDMRALYLGGVLLSDSIGLKGHSDADVLIHAICDALLGALALGDIGDHFPATDPEWKDYDSRRLLTRVKFMIDEIQYRIENLDATILAEYPLIAPFRQAIRISLSQILQIPVSSISVKATTMERLGSIGRGDGIAAMAIVLLTPTLQKVSEEDYPKSNAEKV